VPAFLKTSRSIPVERLSEISSPVLAVWGADDSWVPVEQSVRLMELIPQAEVHVMEQAGHVPMETHPDAYSAIVLGFLDRKVNTH
jgi:pimeloyl-ACP methyl ester carboxylesterase